MLTSRLGFAVLLVILAAPAHAGDDLARLETWPVGSRTWIGPAYWANRLHDWRLANGRLECVENGERSPVRTVHWLTRSVGGDGPAPAFTMSVMLGLRATEPPASEDGWAGFLIGAGGPHVDHRLTALVHHRPAEDGGLLAVVDGTGRATFRDNSMLGEGGGGGWSVAGPLRADECRELDGIERPADSGLATMRPRILMLEGVRGDDGWTLTLTVVDYDRKARSIAIARSVDDALVAGGVALVSHRGTGHWFESWTLEGPAVARHPDRLEGPVVSTLYTVSDGVLKLTAQMMPLGGADPLQAELQVQDGEAGSWRTAAAASRAEHAHTVTFRIAGWPHDEPAPFRVVQQIQVGVDDVAKRAYAGTIRSRPKDPDHPVIAAFTGHKVFTGGLKWNSNGIWFPHADIVAAVAHDDPDLLFFSGDQIYEGDLTPALRRPTDRAILDYLDKWYRWCRAFGALTRDRPCVTIPDDHDVYHGNIWGAGGRKAEARDGMTAQDSGGYIMSPTFVNAVHRTQTSHLPDPVDPAPVEQGISVYTTHLRFGGMSFAILADRQWKSAPAVVVKEGSIVNGWSQDEAFDPATQSDVPGAVLLGERQHRFLEEWASDFSGGTWIKVALSQTLFANPATLPRGAKSGAVIPSLPLTAPGDWPTGYVPISDHDSGGWPQTGRNDALRLLRRGFAFHICGDQHLASTLQYGIDEYRDAGYAFCTPSIANTWPRRWMPSVPGPNPIEGLPFSGDYLDGFGNRMSVEAVANPAKYGRAPARLHDRAPGYGIVRLDRHARTITIECWPRWVDHARGDAAQYEGWPVTFHQLDNHGGANRAWLPTMRVHGLDEPVFQVLDADGTIVYTLRAPSPEFALPVFGEGPYSVRIFDPDQPARGERALEGMMPGARDARVEDVSF